MAIKTMKGPDLPPDDPMPVQACGSGEPPASRAEAETVPAPVAYVDDMVVLHSNGRRWDAVGHGSDSYDHGLGDLLRCPREAARPLLHNAGYTVATADQIQAEIDLLQARIDELRQHLQ
jgi:hypothetical protein